jgi:hypothetical protein
MTNEKTEKTTKDFIVELRQDRADHIKSLKNTIAELNPEAMFADGFDDSLAGYDTHGRAVYFVDGIIQTLIERDGMESEEAMEYFSFNIECAYVGENTPTYIYEE